MTELEQWRGLVEQRQADALAQQAKLDALNGSNERMILMRNATVAHGALFHAKSKFFALLVLQHVVGQTVTAVRWSHGRDGMDIAVGDHLNDHVVIELANGVVIGAQSHDADGDAFLDVSIPSAVVQERRFATQDRRQHTTWPCHRYAWSDRHLRCGYGKTAFHHTCTEQRVSQRRKI